MAGYRLFFFDRQGHIGRAVELECADDAEAVAAAGAHVNGHEVELWRGARMVMTFPRAEEDRPASGGAPADGEDLRL